MLHVEESLEKEEVECKAEESIIESVTLDQKERKSTSPNSEPLEDEGSTKQEREEMTEQQEEEQLNTIENKMETVTDEDKMEEGPKEEMTDFDSLLEEADDDKIEADQEINDELGQEEITEDNMQKQGEEVLEEERMELNAAAKECKLSYKRLVLDYRPYLLDGLCRYWYFA